MTLHGLTTRTSRLFPLLLNNITEHVCRCPGNYINNNINNIIINNNNTRRQLFHVRSIFTLPGSGSLTKEHSEKKIIGYTMEQMYNIVSDVDAYQQFVPFCTSSHVFQRSENHARANLEVGFQVVSEKYTSVLTLARPNLVKSECMDGTLFNHLTCVWRFSQGPPHIPNSCTLNFYISFEFKSILHSQLAAVFFEQVVMKMVDAFLNRARELHGPCSVETAHKQRLTVNMNNKRPVPASTGASAKEKRATRISPRRRVVSIPKD